MVKKYEQFSCKFPVEVHTVPPHERKSYDLWKSQRGQRLWVSKIAVVNICDYPVHGSLFIVPGKMAIKKSPEVISFYLRERGELHLPLSSVIPIFLFNGERLSVVTNVGDSCLFRITLVDTGNGVAR